jgi:hypothetical protein
MNMFSICTGTGDSRTNVEAKLSFILCAADNPTNSCHEISEVILFRFLLKESNNVAIKTTFATNKLEISKIIDLESKISQVETHRLKNISVSISPFGIF